MAKVISIDGKTPVPLAIHWRMAVTAASAFTHPSALPETLAWHDAHVPGTVAKTLQDAKLWSFETYEPLEDKDYWYQTTLNGEGRERLIFEGLATLAEVFLDDTLILSSQNMFLSHEVDVTLSGNHRLAICFRALAPVLNEKRKRARWRPRLPSAQNLRFIRTTLLGHAPGWSPPVHAIGPWRDILRTDPTKLLLRDVDLRASLDGSCGKLAVRIDKDALGSFASETIILHCAGFSAALQGNGTAFTAHLDLPDIEPWWPHTHGAPELHDVMLTIGTHSVNLGRTGFRHVAIDRARDGKGFGLIINGEPVFARGACWTNEDLIGLSATRETYLPALTRMRDAGMNMLRLGGTMVYEGDDFYRLCDEFGIMVWQDFMFANFDYPVDDAAFLGSAKEEACQFLARAQASPCLTVLCGGSEVAQQAAMFGLPKATWSNSLFDDILPGIASDLRPDLAYSPHTPYGGELPFVPHEGVSHYYGVSAYMRPLDDARRANVRFASECLCFANVPDAAPFTLEPDAPRIEHPDFGPRTDGDTGATWYFEKVRNFYTALLYDVDVAEVRRADPARFLDLARATSAEIMEATFAEWRREGSCTHGGLVWNYQDLWPGAGWGIVDSLGVPKAAYYGLKRAFKPVTLIFTDEGNNGLRLHLINETASAKDIHLKLTCLRDGATAVMRANQAFTLQPRSTISLSATELWGGFFDTTYAYRFGEPSHDVTIGQIFEGDSDQPLAEAFHFPLGRAKAFHEPRLAAELEECDGGWSLSLSAQKFAQSVHILSRDIVPEDNWFHLAPGLTRKIRLRPSHAFAGEPELGVASLSAALVIRPSLQKQNVQMKLTA